MFERRVQRPKANILNIFEIETVSWWQSVTKYTNVVLSK